MPVPVNSAQTASTGNNNQTKKAKHANQISQFVNISLLSENGNSKVWPAPLSNNGKWVSRDDKQGHPLGFGRTCIHFGHPPHPFRNGLVWPGNSWIYWSIIVIEVADKWAQTCDFSGYLIQKKANCKSCSLNFAKTPSFAPKLFIDGPEMEGATCNLLVICFMAGLDPSDDHQNCWFSNAPWKILKTDIHLRKPETNWTIKRINKRPSEPSLPNVSEEHVFGTLHDFGAEACGNCFLVIDVLMTKSWNFNGWLHGKPY